MISTNIRRDLEMPESVSHETVGAVLRGTSIPVWTKVKSIVIELVRSADRTAERDTIVEEFRLLWIAVKTPVAADTDPPEPTVEPPVPRSLVDPPPDPVRPTPSLTPPAQPPLDGRIVGALPDRNPHFVGRQSLLASMYSMLVSYPQAPLVLYGPGGAGKTQLAREYLERHGEAYPLVWWVPADRPEAARRSLVALGERLGVQSYPNAEQTVARVLSRLESQQIHYVLVYDGAEDDEAIRRLMPTIGGHVVVTTRRQAWAQDSSSAGLEVPDFDPAEVIQFLHRRGSEVSPSEADWLAGKLGRLPLTLEQMATLQQASGLSWSELVARVDAEDRGLLEGGQPSNYPHTVSAFVGLALNQLTSTSPLAASVFELFAWLGTEPVSVALLSAGRAGAVSQPLSRLLQDRVRLNRAIAEIIQYGVARLHRHEPRIEVSPLVRLALRDRLPAAARERARRNVHEILAAADPGWPDTVISREMYREMAAHILPAELIQSSQPAARFAVYHQIRYRNLTGDYDDADKLGHAAVTAWRDESHLGPDDSVLLRATREWANALRSLGRYQQARELTEDALRRMRASADFGADHPDTLATAASYAADLRLAGRYQEALRLDEESCRRHVERRDTGRALSARHNLAVSHRHVGGYAAAEEIDREQLAHYQQLHGAAHERTLVAVNALGEDLHGLGRYAEALSLLTEYREIIERVLGPVHRGTLLAQRTTARAHRGLGQLTAALELLRTHHEACIESYGADHERTLAATMSYANALRQQGRLGEAHDHATEAVATYRRTFGPGNPFTLAAEVNLATILRAQGEKRSAREADQAAVAALRRVLGEAHPYPLVAAVNLATDLSLAGDHVGALALSEPAYATARAVRGPAHPDTLAAGANLAADLVATGATQRGRELFDEALGGLYRVLRADHPAVKLVAAGNRIDCDIEVPSG
jgi:tetratricopeptide (TPR) repeat protein